MSLPAEWTQIPVSWTLLSQNDGTPCVGRVRFTAENSVLTDGKTFVPDPIFANVVNGVMESINLPSTDDPQISPQQWVWKVEAQTIPTGPAPFYIDVPYDTVGTLNIATAVPLRTPSRLPTVPGPGGSDAGVAGYVADDDSATRTALNAAYAPVSGSAVYETKAIASANYAARRTVLALGNSITNYWATGSGFTTKFAAFVGDTGGTMTLVNAGVGGNTSTQQLARLTALLAGPNIPHQQWVTIVPSVNDRKTGGLTPAATMVNVQKMVALCRWAGAQPILMTEPVLDVPRANATDSTFVAASEYDRRTCNDLIRAYAASAHIPLADVDACFLNDTAAAGDGIHPTGTLSGGVNGLDAIRVIVAESLMGAATRVYGRTNILGTLVGTDDFERADNALVPGGTWTVDAGTWGVTGGKGYVASGASAYNTMYQDAGATDHEAIRVGSATALATAYSVTAFTRRDGTGRYFALLEVAANRTATLKLYRATAANSATQLGSTVTVPGVVGESATLNLASVGTTHTVRVNGMTLIRQTDATYTAGTQVGVHNFGTNERVDSFAWQTT